MEAGDSVGIEGNSAKEYLSRLPGQEWSLVDGCPEAIWIEHPPQWAKKEFDGLTLSPGILVSCGFNCLLALVVWISL